MIIWLTGLPSSGKTTIAKAFKETFDVLLLDGDVLRDGLCEDLGFSEKDRLENIRRIRCLCKILNDNDIYTIVCAITPYEDMRRENRRVLGDSYFEVFVDAPLDVCIERDVKGLYKKSIDNKIKNMTGMDDPFEEPSKPNCVVETDKLTVDECVTKILRTLGDK